MKKKIYLMVIVLFVGLLTPMTAMANEIDEFEMIAPMDLHTSLTYASPTISGGVFSSVISIYGKAKTTGCSYTVYLQKLSGNSWSNTGQTSYGSGTGQDTINKVHTFNLSSRGTYRVKVISSVYGEYGTDNITFYSGERTY